MKVDTAAVKDWPADATLSLIKEQADKAMKIQRSTLGLAVTAVAVAGLSFAGASAVATQNQNNQNQNQNRQGNAYGQDKQANQGQDKQANQGQQKQGKDLVATAKGAGDFKTLVKAVAAADLVETLQGEGPYTVFAPNDEAFEKLPTGTLETLLEEENKDQLKSILLYHVVEGKVMASDVVNLDEAETVQGEAISISTQGETVTLNDTIKVIKTDIDASNGVIHVIDGVLIPVGNGEDAADSDSARRRPGGAQRPAGEGGPGAVQDEGGM